MQWEYKLVERAEMRTSLDALGKDGWELVLVEPAGGLFKRPKPSPVERFTAEQRAAVFAGTYPHAPEPRSKLLNPELAALVRRIGHTDMLLIADGGFPMPREPMQTIDLSLMPGVPSIPQVLEAVRLDFHFDRIIAAEEMIGASPARDAELRGLGKYGQERIPHLEFKKLAAKCKCAIRTGDNTAYANIIVVGA
jgi:D-ribose pyranase